MKVDKFYSFLTAESVNFFCGVPDSLLKDFCFYIDDKASDNCRHIVAANEGNAIALACGHYLATGEIAAVYMQNSGLGNCVNPLLSLADEEVYNIPLLMIIGMRGQVGIKDEPQHIKQGKVTDKILDSMGIKYSFLDEQHCQEIISQSFIYMRQTKKPYALLVSKDFFEKYSPIVKEQKFIIPREVAIDFISKNVPNDSAIIATTGHISRELYECRQSSGQGHSKDFLTVGSMGHASSISAAIALSKPQKQIICFDGDGAFLMHLGAAPIIASLNLGNFKHIIFNNNAHDSVGGLATATAQIDFKLLALSCGYKKSYSVATIEDLQKVLPVFLQEQASALLEVKVKRGARADLGRPKEKPVENKELFMSFLKDDVYTGRGSVSVLPKILGQAKKIIAFTGNKSFKKFENIFAELLAKFEVDYYSDFGVNPDKKDLQKALQNINASYDAIIAIGGGSVIDFAKLFKFNSAKQTPLIAISTTAGSGSEATKFAVLFDEGKKLSIEDDTILPNFAIVDSSFLDDAPRSLKSCFAFDAFAQSIESFWSNKSTKESKSYARRAMILCKENIVDFVNSNNRTSADNMSLASYLAGKAINISKTTAAHALSYVFTSKYKIAHGHGVALSFSKLFKANTKISQSQLNDLRGLDYVNKIATELKNIFSENYFDDLFEQIALQTNLKKLGVENIDEIVSQVNAQRIANNPRTFSADELKGLFNND